MTSKDIEQTIQDRLGLDALGEQLSGTLHQAILAGGEPTRRVVDLLHGTWFGHPLHPALTGLVVGAWSLALGFDLAAHQQESKKLAWAADRLIEVGVMAAVPTALSGLADYSAIPRWASGTATLHALLNSTALTLYLLSLAQRRQGNRGVGVLLATLAYGIATGSAWLGGHLSFVHKVGVTHTPTELQPTEWTTVMADGELPGGKAVRVEVEGSAVLLYRHAGILYAASAICPHAGGPLEEGTFEGSCVQCPWHDSVFDLRDGGIVHGPSAFSLPTYAVRLRGGQIEVKREG